MANNFGGIYAIVNTVNGHRYIGSAVNIKNRWKHHKGYLRKGTHHSSHLQRAWDKYGEDNFTFHVLERVDSREMLVPKEQEYIDGLKPEYNMAPTAGSRLGCKSQEETKRKISKSRIGIHPTEETREKLRESHKGKVLPDEQRRKMSESSKGMYRGWADKAVLQLTRAGEIVNRFKSAMEAQRQTGVGNGVIIRCCKGKRPTAGGFIWKYADN